jgi:predicted nucleic acid-binding protein
MGGSLVDLSARAAPLPDPVVVDTSVVVAAMLALDKQQNPIHIVRAAELFSELLTGDHHAIFPPTAYSELLHVSIRIRNQQELKLNRHAILARYGTRISSWTELFKRDPTIAQQHAAELDQLRRRLVASNIVIAGTDDLGPISSGLPHDVELVRLIGRYGLDTNDAAILMEANRLGIYDIVTMDEDLRRARMDFNVYTWLKVIRQWWFGFGGSRYHQRSVEGSVWPASSRRASAANSSRKCWEAGVATRVSHSRSSNSRSITSAMASC